MSRQCLIKSEYNTLNSSYLSSLPCTLHTMNLKLVVACRWSAVYSTEPWWTACTGFLCPSNYPSWFDLYSVESDVKPQINKYIFLKFICGYVLTKGRSDYISVKIQIIFQLKSNFQCIFKESSFLVDITPKLISGSTWLFMWVGPGKRKYWSYLGKDLDHILDTNKIPKFSEHALVEVCTQQVLLVLS